MKYVPSFWAILIFISIIILVLYISYYFAKKARTSEGYFAAGGKIHWSINGIAFAGDYLSAASFLGICGMIAVSGYDGFLYSIGYLAGWIVALFVVAEPIKRLGKFTFTDAVDAKFNNKGIKLIAAISTLIVSLFYLIPQMVGAGSLIMPLLGLPYWSGVLIVGTIVIIIVATAGMASTTYVQFIKGALLLGFSLALVITMFSRGFSTAPDQGGNIPYHDFKTIQIQSSDNKKIELKDKSYNVIKNWEISNSSKTLQFVELSKDNINSIWKVNNEKNILEETLFVTELSDGKKLYNGGTVDEKRFYQVGNLLDIEGKTPAKTGTLDPLSFFGIIKNSNVLLWNKQVIKDSGNTITVYYQNPTAGAEILKPGRIYKLDTAKGATLNTRLDFISLMIALFLGTAALPHILIRYYTVPSPIAARKSTIVAIAGIGLFYILTLYMGLGAMTGGVIDLTNDNMSAPLLARSFGIILFSIISAIAFATVLGTVSGLICASSGAVAHDIMDRFMGIKMTDRKKVLAGKMAAIGVGIIAMILGLIFKNMNVSYLVGWAFSIAASANLPAIIMILFWKKTTAKGIIASISIGLISALTLILMSQKTFNEVYNIPNVVAPIQINNPAIFSVPISFIVLIIVSLFTQAKKVEVSENSV
ncbi:MAG: cation acetate symporter [Actinobacteria bacterium]|nr:cation acetate symporter [Cyanobacteriota bacterium]MCL5772486.1 cation acetate symporter [Actinomycetota bacterium]